MTTRLVSIVSTTLIGFTCFADSIGPGSLGPNCWSNLGPRAQNFRPLPPPALPPSVKRTDFFNKPQIVVLAGQSPVRNELAAYEIMPAPSIEEISSSVRANTQPNIDVLAYSQKTLAINNVGPNLNTTMIEEADILNSVEVRVALERWMDGFSTVLILQNESFGPTYKAAILKYLISLDIADSKLANPDSVALVHIDPY